MNYSKGTFGEQLSGLELIYVCQWVGSYKFLEVTHEIEG